MASSSSSPVFSNERAGILDTLRGIAVLGIFLCNSFSFTGYSFFDKKYKAAIDTYASDKILSFIKDAFMEGKFYTIFSLLFGIGFSIILIRNEQRGLNPLKIFYRRLFVLALIGAAHLFLFWEEDILLLYALIGCFLPLFRKCSDKQLLVWSVVFIASPVVIDAIKIYFDLHPARYIESFAFAIDDKNGLPADNSFAQYLFKEGSGWKEWRNWQASGFIYRYAYILETNRIPKVLGIFILGFYAGRKMIYKDLLQHKKLFVMLANWGFIIGIPACIGMASVHTGPNTTAWMSMLHTTFYALGVVPLALAYTAVVCLLWIKTNGRTKLAVVAPAGRMALTNYLSQTLIAITMFYGVGFGVAGHIGPTIFLPIALLVYAIQVIISHLWFRYFNYGLLEWLWRQATYGKRLPIKKSGL